MAAVYRILNIPVDWKIFWESEKKPLNVLDFVDDVLYYMDMKQTTTRENEMQQIIEQKMYRVEFKKNVKARKVYSWLRYADSIESATCSAKKALDEEYFGDAVLVSVEYVTHAFDDGKGNLYTVPA